MVSERVHFLFSSDSTDPRSVDDVFSDQFEALTKAGFPASLVSEEVTKGQKPLHNMPNGHVVVYRGWMLGSADYDNLAASIEATGNKPLVTLGDYLMTHHLPNWYPLIADLTPETIVLPPDADLDVELNKLSWESYFLKDFVKSLKTGRGSIAANANEAKEIVAEMREYRGEIEGGICVRRVETFEPETEQRYFVLFGTPSAASDRSTIPSIVHECASKVPSPFFSVDVAKRSDGQLRVVEVGDGQVSDLVRWSAEEFAAMWLRSCKA